MHDQYSENETNIRFALCNVRHLNGDVSGNLPEKDASTRKKIQNTWKAIVIFEILIAAVMQTKIHSLIPSIN